MNKSVVLLPLITLLYLQVVTLILNNYYTIICLFNFTGMLLFIRCFVLLTAFVSNSVHEFDSFYECQYNFSPISKSETKQKLKSLANNNNRKRMFASTLCVKHRNLPKLSFLFHLSEMICLLCYQSILQLRKKFN